MFNKKSAIILSSFILSGLSHAQYYKTLPKGVRLGVYRNVTSEIKSNFNPSSSEAPMNYEIRADVKFLESIENETLQSALEILKPYPDAYEKLNLGEYKIKAKANVNVNGYGFAYGITNRVTAYMAMPIFKANVQLDYTRSQGNSNDEVASNLQNNTTDDFAQAIGDFVDQYSDQLDVNDGFIQSLVVNGFGYDEVGNWQGQGLGDIELGLMYNFYETSRYGLLLTGGAVAPTGRVDDPDIIQDIGFGDGQWDLFTEFGGSLLVNDRLTINSFVRYTHQLASDKDLRVPYSGDVFIGDETTTYREKLGNRSLFHVSSDVYINDWFLINAAYEYDKIEAATYNAYDSKFSYSNDFLANNTFSSAHNVRLTSEFTTVGLYQQKRFALPAAVKFIYQTMVQGTNTPKVDRYELELRMYF